MNLSDQKIERALLSAYRRYGRIRIPLPALISYALRKLSPAGDMSEHLEMFFVIHKFIRTHWGNGSLFSRVV